MVHSQRISLNVADKNIIPEKYMCKPGALKGARKQVSISVPILPGSLQDALITASCTKLRIDQIAKRSGTEPFLRNITKERTCWICAAEDARHLRRLIYGVILKADQHGVRHPVC